MDVDLVFKIAAVGILVSVLNQVLTRSGREEQATMTTLAGLIVVLMMVVQKISDLFELVKTLFGLLCAMDMIALGAAGVVAALCAVVVRQKTPEIAVVLVAAACVLLLWNTLPLLETIRDVMEELADLADISPTVLRPMLQTVGLALVTKLAASLCRDAGEGGVASFVEVAGAAAAVLVSLPLLKMVLQLVMGLL